MSAAGMGLTYFPNPYERGKSDIEKIQAKNKSDKQEPTTPKVHNTKSWDTKEAFKTFNGISNTLIKDNKDPLPYLVLKNTSKTDDKEEPTGGNPNGDLDVDLSNINSKNGWGRLDGSDMDSGNSTPVANPKSKPKVRTKTAVQKTTAVDDGKSKEWYESLANSSYANDKEHETDMKAYREMQAKATADNDGKSKEWYESLANSSYANDKKYEADMKAFRKMQADEIAKNGYYTDSQGVKVYAKAMTDKPKKESNNE